MRNRLYRILGLCVSILGLFVALTPKLFFPICEAEHLGSVTAYEPVMRCFWFGQAEILLGICVVAAGLPLMLRPSRDTLFAAGPVLIALGAAVVLVSLNLIIGSRCGHQLSICQMGTKPAERLSGGLVMVLGTVALVLSLRKKKQP